jgi:hypothetical protein
MMTMSGFNVSMKHQIGQSGNQLHQLFTTILCHSEVSNPKILWESTCEVLSEDILYSRRKLLNFQTLQLTYGRIKAYALMEIEKLMRQDGKSMKDFLDIEMPSLDILTPPNNNNRFGGVTMLQDN